ncbi:histidine kinase-like protein [Kitasatospora sp. SolWspMP-SS2h]|uniref:sensor histidine kinase n=1 Tax=Kitasatospora sp. SolWspMP-SS2h TaxID=1305729 RepID=UPI000DBA8CDA|nr:sensor histidine kinase [Kitasatospora sp. SolWspMP-SS2h]RAJ38387.1 histidine kinase-like protein [Kitasatospora sp. SolWspMP-SS2h]
MRSPEPGRRLTHQALVYGSDEEFLAAAVPFCRDGLDRGDAVLVVTTGANTSLLRQALDGDAARVELVDALDWYRAPGRTLGAYHRYVDRCTADGAYRQVRVIGESVWHGRDPLERAEWTRYEAVINAALASCPAWIVCPYDTRVLPRDVVDGARRTHPESVTGRAAHPSGRYAAPDAVGAPWTRRLSAVAAEGERAVLRFGDDPAPARAFVTERAASLGLDDRGVQRLVFAVNEIVTNAVQYGGGGQLTLCRSGHRVVCDVTSPSRGSVDWYLGYLPPDPRQPRGHALWVVRQLCDLVEIDSGPELTTVRLHLSPS